MRQLVIAGGFIATALLACTPARAAPACQNLEPTSNPDQNYRNIVACLAAPEALTKLARGVFSVNHMIKTPPGATLAGSGGSVLKPTDAAEGFPDNSIITLSDRNVVRDIAFVAGGRLKQTCCTAVVSFTGSNSRLENADVSDRDVSSLADQAADIRVVGVYFIGGPDSRDNVASHVKVHGVNLGVVFRKGLTVAAGNRVEDSEIFDLACDAVTFAGGGVLQGSRLHDAGFNCEQKPTPIPGGGIYVNGNVEGAKIVGNTITDICGHGLDIVASENVTITGNTIVQKNAPMHGRYPICVGGSPATLVDDSNLTVTNNVFSVTDAPPLGPFLRLFPAYAKSSAAVYAPLRDKDREIFAVRMLRQTRRVSGNRFVDNKMIAECSPDGPCAGHGVALFISPGAGDAGTNSFLHNTLIGTESPALRCGHDRWEGNLLFAKAGADGGRQSGGSSAAQGDDACSAQ